VNSVAMKFFSMELEVKKKYLYRYSVNDTQHNGYICVDQERWGKFRVDTTGV